MAQIPDQKSDICPVCGKKMKEEVISQKFLKPGTVLQRKFIVGYPIGAGGFGNTYIGWNQLLLRKVAIKEFYPEQYTIRSADRVTVTVPDKNLEARFKNGLRQFLEEARSVAALQDIKGVVKISNFFEENGTGYIVMEYLEGMDVKTILKKSGDKKDYEWCRRVVLTVLDTLKEIHKRGVLHRDIAPDNIFVTQEGVIKLIDFGAAKHASALANTNAEIMLKIGYAPIEQYSRNAKQGPYTDLYAVAALFYRMLTGQKPVPANERVKRDTLIPPSDMGIELPEQAELAIMVCLNVQPQFRLQSAEEFMEALDGKYFQPVYEPEWILPPIEEEKTLLNRIAALPMAAKITICFLVICLVGGLTAGGIAFSKNHAKEVTELKSSVEDGKIQLEDYKDQTFEVVRQKLAIQGFENVTCTYELSSKEEGVILGQSIEAGEIVALDEELVFTVSGGTQKYTMPDCVNKIEQEIINIFKEKNFNIEVYEDPYEIKKRTEEAKNPSQANQGKICIKYDFSANIVKGYCYKQTVEAGEEIDTDQDITFILSIGGEEKDFEVEIPDFTGMTNEEVQKALEDAKLTDILEVSYTDKAENSNTVKKDCVVAQSINAGEKINLLKEETRKLELTLSAGPKPRRTPQFPVQEAPQEPQPEEGQ